MPRFSAAFSRRKSVVDDAPVQESSFRVIERHDVNSGRSFDGGARMARAAAAQLPKQHQDEFEADDNIFEGLNMNRGSGASHSTKATSTDTSSRHSNVSTAPSSADVGASGQDELRHVTRKPLQEAPNPPSPIKSSRSSFLDRAGRTFSFGAQKKHSAPVPLEESIAEVPPVPTIQYQDPLGRARGMTASTASTATPPKLDEETAGMDLGGDFGTMFSSFDKRASSSTLRNTGTVEQQVSAPDRQGQLSPVTGGVDATSPRSWDSSNTNDGLLESRSGYTLEDRPPPVPTHGPVKQQVDTGDEDMSLLQDTVAAGRFLSGISETTSAAPPGFYRRQEDGYSSLSRKPVKSFGKQQEENMFDGTFSRLSRKTHHHYTSSRPDVPARNKVMTTAQFERYRMDKDRLGAIDQAGKAAEQDDDDEINYDDDEDEAEKSKQQAKQRRKQEAHMAVYRQQMMKVTGETSSTGPAASFTRPTLPLSLSAPLLGQQKTPSPDPTSAAPSDDDEDEEIPLAILQAHGFPTKNKPPVPGGRLSSMGSNPNLRASALAPPPRPGSAAGTEAPATSTQRHSTLPAFARGLPQDPFVGASLAKPAMRESLALGGGLPASPTAGPLPPGGLVGVIANEERSRAMRRGSPSVDNQKLIGNVPSGPNGGYDPMAGIPPHMMYPNGMGGMGPMGPTGPMPPQPMLTPGDQAQIQMTQQMQQFMQMQMQFMQMMASGQQQAPSPTMPQQPYMGFAGSQSMADLSLRQSMVGEPMQEPQRLHQGMRTMSMVQPRPPSIMQQGYAGPIPTIQAGYTPSIAPSERSNVGLPGRYRPVSQAPGPMLNPHQRSNTMSGALSQWDDDKRKSSVSVLSKAAAESEDDDDDEGWEAMKAKRDKKLSMWKSKKGFGSELGTLIN